MAKPLDCYCLVEPDGTLKLETVRRRRLESLTRILNWRDAYRKGFRCKKFKLVPDDLDLECPTCKKWRNSKLPILVGVRDLEITIDRKKD